MSFKVIGQLAGALLLSAGLAGCMDVTMEVEVLTETTGKTITTAVVGADFYPMMKAGMASAEAGAAAGTATAPATPAEPGFCEEEGATLTENADGSATCVTIKEGELATLTGEDAGAKYEVVSPGVVKVTFSTAEMQSEMGTEAQDAETKAMMEAFFTGHTITLRVKGKEITESNMTISADKTSAEIVIPFLDLMNGTAQLPAELTAVVKTN